MLIVLYFLVNSDCLHVRRHASFSLSIVCLPTPLLPSFVLVCVPLDPAVLGEMKRTGSSNSAGSDGNGGEKSRVRIGQGRGVQLPARRASQQTETVLTRCQTVCTHITTAIHPSGHN